MHNLFRKFANHASTAVGSSWAFLTAFILIIVWALTGPIFHFSDSWQLFINSLTTLVTFLMVFLIQNTQNRDSKAIHLKLDTLIKAHEKALNKMLDAEDMPDDELEKYKRVIISTKSKKRKNHNKSTKKK